MQQICGDVIDPDLRSHTGLMPANFTTVRKKDKPDPRRSQAAIRASARNRPAGPAPRISMTVNGFTLDFCDGAHGGVVRNPISEPKWRPAMKTLITVFALAALAATSAMAKAPKAEAIHGDAADIHQSYAGGNQTFPNPDRDFEGRAAP
jgi:hypothetical protein